MKKKDLAALRTKTVSELKKTILERKMESLHSFAKIKTAEEKNLKKPRALRLEIARLLTILREKEIIAKEEGKEETK